MPRQRQFYEPIIQKDQPPAPEAPRESMTVEIRPLQGVLVPEAGVYVRLDAVVESLREMAGAIIHTHPEGYAVLMSVADAMGQPVTEPEAAVAYEPTPVIPPLFKEVKEALGLPEDQHVTLDTEPVIPPPAAPPVQYEPVENVAHLVDRVEVFPDADGKWYARSVSDDGTILKTTNGSFDKPYVIRDAGNRWPGKEIHEIADAQADSIWDEQHHAFGFNGRRRPSPRRLWSQ